MASPLCMSSSAAGNLPSQWWRRERKLDCLSHWWYIFNNETMLFSCTLGAWQLCKRVIPVHEHRIASQFLQTESTRNHSNVTPIKRRGNCVQRCCDAWATKTSGGFHNHHFYCCVGPGLLCFLPKPHIPELRNFLLVKVNGELCLYKKVGKHIFVRVVKCYHITEIPTTMTKTRNYTLWNKARSLNEVY